jgi:hypothetical protein
MKMKTQNHHQHTPVIIYAITFLFCLQVQFLFAANLTDNHRNNKYTGCETCSMDALLISLAPSTPGEATFLDVAAVTEINFAPETPAEATFSDEAPSSEINLAPKTPAEASFDDNPESMSADILKDLAPKAPAEAEFID